MIVSGFTQRTPPPTDEDLSEFPGCHTHCLRCRLTKCLHPVDNVTSCEMTSCQGCGFTYHKCKSEEHALTCEEIRVPCLNACYGCPHFMKRSHLPKHLPVCPASVVCCGEEWNRWPMYTKEKGVKHSLPPTKTYIDCGQLDVALAMRDQRMLFDSLRAPKQLKRALRNPLTQKYPAAPLLHRSSSQDSPDLTSPGDRSQTVSDDDTDAPWDLSRRQPGLRDSIGSHFVSVSKETKEELMSVLKNETCSNSSISPSRNQSSPTSEESSPSSKVVQCSITKNAQSLDPSDENAQQLDSNSSHQMTSSVSSDKDGIRSRSVSVLRDIGGSQLDKILDLKLGDENDNNDICLHKVLGVSLTHDVINKYCNKPASMYTFICSQNFRRDQYKWHVKNVHEEIISQLDGYLEQRCPLAYAGCTFSFQRLVPSQPDTVVHFSWLQESFGLKNIAEPCNTSSPQLSSSYSSNKQDDYNFQQSQEKAPESLRYENNTDGEMHNANTDISNSNNIYSNNTGPSILDLHDFDRQFDELKVDVSNDFADDKNCHGRISLSPSSSSPHSNQDLKSRQHTQHEGDLCTSTSVQPVLYTASNPDSKVLLVYNIEETSDVSSTFRSFGLNDLPFEVLQQIARRLDSFSLCNLSLTCRLLRDVCCSLLDDMGIVVLNWQRKKIGDKVSWEVVDKRWSFSTSFEPIRSWKFNTDHVTLSDHLKTCPFNQDKLEHSGGQVIFL